MFGREDQSYNERDPREVTPRQQEDFKLERPVCEVDELLRGGQQLRSQPEGIQVVKGTHRRWFLPTASESTEDSAHGNSDQPVQVKQPVSAIGGRLRHFTQAWSRLTSDRVVLSAISGYEIPFKSRPVQRGIPGSCAKRSDEGSVQEAIDKLQRLGVVVVCQPQAGQFVSSFFLVPKKDETMRFVLNLKKLNYYVLKEHFKMEDVSCHEVDEQGRVYSEYRLAGRLPHNTDSRR